MSDATCKTCPFFESDSARAVDGKPRGLCHHVAHEALASDPERYEHWWCSEHPLRQRDRLAAMAMQGIAANWQLGGETPEARIRALAKNAYAVADAMLAARKP